jgi:hypothetical protein
MYIYRVEMPNNTYKVIEADFFTVTTEGDDQNAYFYVVQKVQDGEELPQGVNAKAILIGFAKNPTFIQFDDTYMVKPNRP